MDLIQAKSEAEVKGFLLSEELDIEVLVRLPVSCLLRFKRVGKAWRSIISSPFFIQKHLQVSNSTTPNPNLIFKIKSEIGDTGFVVSHQTLQVIKARIVPSIRHNWWPRILGTCNGLICLYCTVDYRDVAIWNPTTGKKKDLPCPLLQKSHFRAAGFGFDADNNDYKMVLIHLFIDVADNGKLSKPRGFQLEYYSLRTNSWKLVNETQGMDLLFDGGTVGAYTNGMISWLAYTVEQEEAYRKDEIISFDTSKEVLIRTRLPGNIGSHAVEESVNHVRVLNESFAVVSDNFHKFEFDIWVLREVGVVESWTKLFTVGLLPHSVSDPLVIWKGGVVFWNKKDKELILYDSANQPNRCVGIPKKQYDLMDAVVYRESLVPLSMEGTT